MIIRRHLYNGEGKITAIVRDGNYLWLVYKNATSCQLKKVSIFDPSLVYYDIEITVDEITRMKVSGNYIYLAVDDDTYIGMRLKTSDPWGDWNNINIPTGINEKSVDVAITGNNWFLLTPGELSGENAKVIKIDETTYDETIDLTTVFNASSMTIDDFDNLWVVTNELEAKVIKIEESSGGFYSYSIIYS